MVPPGTRIGHQPEDSPDDAGTHFPFHPSKAGAAVRSAQSFGGGPTSRRTTSRGRQRFRGSLLVGYWRSLNCPGAAIVTDVVLMADRPPASVTVSVTV